MSPQTNRKILYGMLAGVLLGAVAGFVIPDVMLAIAVIGRLFVNALQILLLPLIPALIIVGVAGLAHAPRVTRAAASTVLYFLATTLAAVVIGTVLVLLIQPGRGAQLTGAFVPDMVNRARAAVLPDVFASFIPDNLVAALGAGQYLGLVVLSLVFAGIVAAMGARARVVVDFFKAIADISLEAVNLVIYAAPVGLFVLVGSAIARNPEAIGSLGGNLAWLMLTFLLGLLLHGLVVLPVLLQFLGKRNPLAYGATTVPALTTAFGTASSAAALPITYRNVVEEGGVDARAGALVLPLGASMNANGTALYLTIAALFTAQLYSVPLSIVQLIAIPLLAVILSLGTASITGGALFALAVLFAALNYPTEAYNAIGLLVVVDWLFDRGRAALNVWGDMVGAAVISESFEFKTARSTRGITTPERAPVRRERGAGRRERPPREHQTTEGGRDSRRPPREPREGDRRGGRGRDRDHGRKPERTPQDQPPRRESEPRPAATTKQESRPASPPQAEPSRGQQRRERPEPPRQPKRESERPAPPEQRPRPPAIPTGGETPAPDRGRPAAPVTPPLREADRRPSREPAPPVEPPAPREPARETAPDVPVPEIRRRPLPIEVRAAQRPDDRPGATPPAEAPAPESPVRAEAPRREFAPEPPPPPPIWRPAEPAEPKTDKSDDEFVPDAPATEPRLREILASLAASRERLDVESADAEGEDSDEKEGPGEPEPEFRPASFGRGRARHGLRPSDQTQPPEPETPEPTDRKDGYDVSAVPSFGRARRKRTR
ncbi:MAG TPA: cation:dicarboxylase symporter family transporter [candidate division Zixibacteria bacterium]|nr:cation:dicarboxylase symporter family transporter [candidate division Zixibacteria bacterium]